jgi:hypothetical protein
MGRFDYLTSKFESADFVCAPFKHIYIENFFREEDFHEIIGSPVVNVPEARNDEELVQFLYQRHFKEIGFPGTITDIPTYIKWHNDRTGVKNLNQATTEGFGITMRLKSTEGQPILSELDGYFRNPDVWRSLAEKFGLNFEETRTDFGLQKYLDGYEISPHPDIRSKALTFMVNINPHPASETLDFHTRYLHLAPDYEFVREAWNREPNVERCWVPWNWCVIDKTQTKNNSIVIFSPANDTIHAVKAAYDHLKTQRTQLYGNLWYKNPAPKQPISYAGMLKYKTLYAVT